MPNTSSAKKALRQSKRRRVINLRVINAFKDAVREFMKAPSQELLNKAYSKLDIASKKHIIHKNKASRFKSKLAKYLLKSQAK